MSRGLVWGDGLELAAVCRSLGVAHPTGYPLFTLLGHLFTYLPIASPAQSVTFFCSLVMAASCWVLYRLFSALAQADDGVASGWALVGTLIFAWSAGPWSHGTRIEVYGLQIFFQLVASWIFVEHLRSPSVGHRSALAFFWGLGIGHHLLAIVSAPLVLAALWVPVPGEDSIFGRSGWPNRLFQRLSRPLLFGVLGLLPMIYVPLRAMMSPALSFGDPSTWERWWWTLTGGDYLDRFVYAGPQIGLGSQIADRALALLRFLAEQVVPGSTGWFGWLLVLAVLATLTVLGLLRAGGRERRPELVTAWSAMGGLYLVVLTVYGISDIEDYQLGFYAWLWPMAWTGLRATGRRATAGWGRPSVQEPRIRLGLVLLFPILLLMVNWRVSDRSGRDLADRYAERLFEALPPNSVLVTEGDVATGTAWYLKHGLDRRKDVRVVVLNLLPRDWYARQLKGQGLWHGPLPSARRSEGVDRVTLLWQAVLAPKVGEVPISWVVTQATSNALRRRAAPTDVRRLLTDQEIVEIVSLSVGPPLHGRVESVVPSSPSHGVPLN